MTEKEILKKAINEAIRNGWKGWHSIVPVFIDGDEKRIKRITSVLIWSRKEDIIFSHSFAKAFWFIDDKEEAKRLGLKLPLNATCPHDNYNDCNECYWRKELQRMVLEPNPIQYLAKFLEKKGKGK